MVIHKDNPENEWVFALCGITYTVEWSEDWEDVTCRRCLKYKTPDLLKRDEE